METPETPVRTSEKVLARIDAIIYELQDLRTLVTGGPPSQVADLSDELFGALGQRTWDEYDLELDWQRFSE